MSYRSLKRVLGETNLERKCRWLFGFCLALLIGFAFFLVDSVAENLVKETTLRKGRDSIDAELLRRHWERWETDPERKRLAQEMTRDLQTQGYGSKVLALEHTPGAALPSASLPEDADEKEILLKLKAALERQIAEKSQTLAQQKDPDAGWPPAEQSAFAIPSDIAPKHHLEAVPSKGEYHYYQPVYWKKSCSRCHIDEGFAGIGAVSAREAPALFDRAPFLVFKIIIPDKETQDAIAWTRAILIATAISTVFLAMISLHLIVRYVIVKPLTHLRDVSDEISRGETELRAEIHTNDEFEELAESFNRMLRHLTDTQAELRQVNSDLDGKVDQLAQLNMRLYEMNRLKGDFLANMSHELRTPLNSIIGFSEVLQGIDSLSDKQKRYAKNIQKSGRLLLEMINDILDLAKMEAGKMEVRPSEFRLDALIGAQCDLVRSLTEEKNIDLAVDVQSDAPPLRQDQSKVQQILTNLLSNAIKFTPEGGRITVSGRRDANGQLQITVADTGVGIAQEDREIIFEKFRQGAAVFGGDNLTREYSGTGLGLSIVKELCKLLGGEITFQSELGKGSTFKVTLPWTQQERPRPDVQRQAMLDELTKPPRSDFARSHPSAVGAAAPGNSHNLEP